MRRRSALIRAAALVLVCAVTTGGAYAWYRSAVNSDNTVTVGRSEIRFSEAGTARKYFETELKPTGEEFSPADPKEAEARAKELGPDAVAAAEIEVVSEAATDLSCTLTVVPEPGDPAVLVSVRGLVFCAEEQSYCGALADVRAEQQLPSGSTATYLLFVWCTENGFAEGKTLRFTLKAEAVESAPAYPTEIVNGSFETDAGWEPTDLRYSFEAARVTSAGELDLSDKDGSYVLYNRTYGGYGFRSSVFTASGDYLSCKLGGFGIEIRLLDDKNATLATYTYIGADLRLYACAISIAPWKGKALRVEVWFTTNDPAAVDAFSTSDPLAENYVLLT